jgi:hypothetical protein
MPALMLRDGRLSRAEPQLYIKSLYVALFVESDLKWKFSADPVVVQADCFTHERRATNKDERVTEEMVAQWLLKLEGMRFIRFYPVDECDYLHCLKYTRELRPKIDADKYPAPERGYTKRRYIPQWGLPAGEPVPPSQQPAAPNPRPPDQDSAPRGDESECCLLSKAANYGLTGSQAATVIGSYCTARKRKNWCNGPKECHAAIIEVAGRAKAHQPKVYHRYLLECLLKSLEDDADKMTQGPPRQRGQSEADLEPISRIVKEDGRK